MVIAMASVTKQAPQKAIDIETASSQFVFNVGKHLEKLMDIDKQIDALKPSQAKEKKALRDERKVLLKTLYAPLTQCFDSAMKKCKTQDDVTRAVIQNSMDFRKVLDKIDAMGLSGRYQGAVNEAVANYYLEHGGLHTGEFQESGFYFSSVLSMDFTIPRGRAKNLSVGGTQYLVSPKPEQAKGLYVYSYDTETSKLSIYSLNDARDVAKVSVGGTQGQTTTIDMPSFSNNVIDAIRSTGTLYESNIGSDFAVMMNNAISVLYT
jgi:hypothetical protein